MFLKHLDLTTALRPSYLPEEVLLFVQDNVGLYEGKFKLPQHQNGQVYLTSFRICYVDKDEPRVNSVAVDLKDVDRYEFYAGFLKSSAKVTLFPKPQRASASRARSVSTTASPNIKAQTENDNTLQSTPPPQLSNSATWVCVICSFSNPVPVNFDPATANAHTNLPPCKACGIKPTLPHVLKAAITSASKNPAPPLASPIPQNGQLQPPQASSLASQIAAPTPNTANTKTEITCPRCTFSNHPSLNSCEMCGASLPSRTTSPVKPTLNLESQRTDSPGPVLDQTGRATPVGSNPTEGIKLSFRGGGEKIFYERLKNAMTQRKWLLQNAPPPPNSSRSQEDNPSDPSTPSRPKTAGIAGLEQLGLNKRKNNEILIGSAFEDLEALMTSAKDVVALAEQFARQKSTGGGTFSAEESAILAESASQLGLVTTKDMLGGSKSESLYLSELSRNMAEFLTDDSRGVLKKAGGILTLVDLWAMFNRSRGGVELVSPMDFEKSARLWESLKLPVRLRTFRSGIMVVQGRDRTDETTIKSLLAWLQDLHEFPPDRDVSWDWREFGRGVTAQDAAERFGWSLGVAEEELLMAEDKGVLCREEGLEGLKFWENFIGSMDPTGGKTADHERDAATMARLKNMGLI